MSGKAKKKSHVMSNVIDFQSRKEAIQKQTDYDFDEMFPIDFAISACRDVIEVLYDFDIDVRDNPDAINDLYAIIESVRAVIWRVRGEELPFHLISDKMFEDSFEDPKNELELFLERLEIDLTD